MSNLSKKKLASSSRRQFITRIGLGSVAVAGLSSCDLSDLNFIGRLKEKSGPPLEKDLETFVELSNLRENIGKVVVRTRKAIANLKDIPPELQNLLSADKLKKLEEEEIAYYRNFYTKNYTASQIKELIKIYRSQVWQKFTQDMETLNTVKPGDTDERPSSKFTNQINEILNSKRKKPTVR